MLGAAPPCSSVPPSLPYKTVEARHIGLVTCWTRDTRRTPRVFRSAVPPCSSVHPTPHAPRPTPYTLRPTPYTLHPAPYTHPTPCTLHPTSLCSSVPPALPLSREFGTCKTVKARFWPWSSGKNPHKNYVVPSSHGSGPRLWVLGIVLLGACNQSSSVHCSLLFQVGASRTDASHLRFAASLFPSAPWCTPAPWRSPRTRDTTSSSGVGTRRAAVLTHTHYRSSSHQQCSPTTSRAARPSSSVPATSPPALISLYCFRLARLEQTWGISAFVAPLFPAVPPAHLCRPQL